MSYDISPTALFYVIVSAVVVVSILHFAADSVCLRGKAEKILRESDTFSGLPSTTKLAEYCPSSTLFSMLYSFGQA